ncbi:MAG: GNAT family protein [Thermodesulfobacteriota bacterium]
MNHFVEGERVYLRALDLSDIPIWFDWFNDPQVTEHMNKGIFPNTRKAQEEYFDTVTRSRSDIQLGIVLKESDRLIGIIGIHKIDWVSRHGDISIVVGDENCRGKGIATESVSLIVKHAFMKMNLRRLTAGTPESNIGCRRCFEKNGFVLEGVKRKHLFSNGAYIDVCFFGLLREDWKHGKA